MKRILLAGSAVFLTSLAALAASTNWNSYLQSGMPSDLKFGVVLGGNEPFDKNADDLMAPASTQKLLTAGAALDRLGADYRFPTKLQWQQSSSGVATKITLVGSGDPTWGMQEFGYQLDWHVQALAKALADQGVKEADSTITLQMDPRWQVIRFPSGWKEADSEECGGSTGQAFNLSANCALYKVTGLNSGVWATGGVDTPVELRLTAGKSTVVGATLVHPTPDTYGYVITGTWSQGSGPEYITLPIHDTQSWVQNLLVRALTKNGINVHAVSDVPADSQAKEQIFYSPKLAVILQPFLKNSINFVGDALLKAIGYSAEPDTNTDLREAGLKYVRAFVSSAGPTDGMILNDGSGLSRTARISPRMMYNYLKLLRSREDFASLLAALPVAGHDGTLRNRMKGTAAEGVLKAKTGTLDGVYNLAGYVPHGKEFTAFVIYSETSPGRASVVRGAIDRIGEQMTRVNAAGGGAVYTPASYNSAPERVFPFVPEHSGENFD